MIEIFLILVQFFIIYFLLSFNVCVLNKEFFKFYKLSLPENIALNSIVFLNFILLISFLNLDLFMIVSSYFLYLFSLIAIYIYRFKSIYISSKDNFFYFILLFITSTIIFLEVSNNLVIGWDAQKFWIYKTLNFYNGNTITNLSSLENPWYPYLGSLSWSFFWKVSFLEHEYSGRLFYVFFYLSSLLLLINNFKFSNFYKFIFFITLILISYDHTYQAHWSMFSGNQEILVFSLISIAMHFLYSLSKNDTKLENLNIISILLICNLLVWIKHEGFVLSLSLILTLIFFFNLTPKKKFYIFIVFLGTIFLKFLIFDYYNLNPDGVYHAGFEQTNISTMIEKFSLERIMVIIKFLSITLLSNYLMLIGVFLLLMLIILKKKLKRLFYIIFFALFNVIIFCGIYLMTDANLVLMLKTGMDRVIYQFSPFAIIFLVELYNSRKVLFK